MSRDLFRKPTHKQLVQLPPDVDAATTGMVATPEEVAEARARETRDRAAALVERRRQQPILAAIDPVGSGTFVGPPDMRSSSQIQAEENARLNAEDAAQWSPEERTAHRMVDDLRNDPEFAFLSSGLDTAALGLDDEIIAAGMTGMGRLGMLDEPVDYRTLQRGLDEATALSAEEHPWPARAGMVGGIAATAPLAEFFGPSATSRFLPAVAGRTAIGAGLGGIGGYLGAEEGEELGGTIQGALTGATFAGTGSALVGAGRRLAAPGGLARMIPGAAVESMGYGLEALPGMSQHTILEPGELALEAPEVLGHSAAIGGGFGAGLGLVSSLARTAGSIGRGMSDSRPTSLAGSVVDDFDEAALDIGYTPDELARAAPTMSADPMVNVSQDPRATVAAMREARAREPWLARLWRESTEIDPTQARLFSLGMTRPQDLRRVTAAFGSPENFIATLNAADIAQPNTTYPVRAARAEAARVAEQLGPDLGRYRETIASRSRGIPGSTIADDLEDVARRYTSGFEDDADAALSAAIRNRADDFRYGRGNRPTTSMSPVEELAQLSDDAALVLDPEFAPVTEFPPEAVIPYDVLTRPETGLMARQAYRNRGTYSGSRTGAPSAADEAGLDAYRSMARAREAESLAVLGPEEHAERQLRSRMWQAAQMVGEAPYDVRNPAQFRGSLGGIAEQAAGGGPLGRLTGFLQERLIGEYQPSIMAVINETGARTPAEVVQQAASLVRGIDTLPAELRTRLDVIASAPPRDMRAAQATIAEARELARRQGGDALLAGERAYALANGADSWPVILRALKAMARTAPEAADRVAWLAEQAASRGTLPAIAASLSNMGQFQVLDEIATREMRGDAAGAEDADATEAEREERRMLGLPVEGDAEEAPVSDEDEQEERRLLGLPPL